VISQFIQFMLHLDVHLNEWIRLFGPNIYGLLFLVVFCETGLVVTPFLPGDSLLFALGALAAGDGSPLNFSVLLISLTTASILGDAVNYFAGQKLGPKVFRSETSWFFNRHHLLKTQKFYERYGGKTIILARFVPIIRTFAPFIAGVGNMRYRKFFLFNVVGGVAWVAVFLTAGFKFGNLPTIKKNFHIVILAIIAISLIPPVVEWLRSKRPVKTPVEV
jgi:membrane-associated protein